MEIPGRRGGLSEIPFMVGVWRFSGTTQLQRQHVLLSYFKTPSVGPVWGSNPQPPARQSGTLPTELTKWRVFLKGIVTTSLSAKVDASIHKAIMIKPNCMSQNNYP